MRTLKGGLINHSPSENHFNQSSDSSPTLHHYQHFYGEVEYWKPYDMLEILKATLSETVLGHAKQIVKYRDWVAHGKNPRKLPSALIKPIDAYDTLNEIINTLPD